MSQSLPPRCADRYRHVRLAGTGAHGAVYLATQLDLDRPVAVKVLHFEVSRDVETVTRFGQEARFTAGLAHPNIVRLIEHDLDDDPPWIVYEYLDGLTLHQVVQKGPMSWRSALAATAQVLAALEVAHNAGILHRDIKPSNVMQVGEDAFKLTDFGLARLALGNEKVTRTGCIVGTPAYLAPEVMQGAEHSKSSDLFAVGAMLYKLATGQVPPRHDLVMAPGHLEDPGLPAPSAVVKSVPPAVDRLVRGCTHRDPAARWPTAQALKRAVEEALADPENGAADAPGPRGDTSKRRLRAPEASRAEPDDGRRGAPAGARARRTAAVVAGVIVTVSALVAALAPRGSQPEWVDLNVPSASASAASAAPVASSPGGVSTPFAGKQVGASAVPRAYPERQQFRMLVARVRSRWGKHNAILAVLNPIHSDIPEAARLAALVAPPARVDHAELARIADTVSDAYPDPATAPEEALFWLTRTSAARFFAWSYLQVITQVQSSTAALLSNGQETMADAREMMGSFARMDFGRDGVVLIRRYLSSAGPLFEQMARAPERAGPDAFDLLFDARELARFRGIGAWAKRDDEELRKLAARFKEDMAKLKGPTGEALGRLVSLFWEWGDPLGKVRMTRQSYEDALADIDTLAAQMPAARHSILQLSKHMKDEMASFPPATRGK